MKTRSFTLSGLSEDSLGYIKKVTGAASINALFEPMVRAYLSGLTRSPKDLDEPLRTEGIQLLQKWDDLDKALQTAQSLRSGEA